MSHPKNKLAAAAQRHHALAKALAQGVPLAQAAERARYSLLQAERLAGDLVFQELIEFYRGDASHDL